MFKRYENTEGFIELKGSNNQYFINVDGCIKDASGSSIPYNLDHEGYATVHCLGWDGEREYRIADLMVIQFKYLYIPIGDYDKITAFHIDSNKYNLHASNIGYRFKGGKLEYVKQPGFYYVPGLTKLAINSEGILYNTINNTPVSMYISKHIEKKNITNGYYEGSISLGNKRRMISRHRCLALTFLDYPNNIDTLTVNHINSIPGDDKLENLEFISRTDNNKHAVANSLRSQNTNILVRNVLTKEVIEYPSMAECARQMGFKTTEAISYRATNKSFGYVFNDGTQFKLKNDIRDWIEPDELTIERIKTVARKNNSNSTPIVVRNCRDLSTKEYTDIKYVPKDTFVEYKVIKDSANNRRQEIYNGYQFKHKYDKNPWRTFTLEEFNNSIYKGKHEINFRNLLTNEKLTFPNIYNAETWLKKDVYTSINRGKQPLFIDGWQAKLSHWEWEIIPDIEDALYRLQKDIMAYNPNTKEVIVATNAVELSKIIKTEDNKIRTAAFTRGKNMVNGYQIRLGVTNDPWPVIKDS
jgi:hypothetical protein